MADLAVITPTRGRPDQLRQMLDATVGLAVGSVDVWVGIDDDDPADYGLALGARQSYPVDGHLHLYREPRRSLSGWTNHLATLALRSDQPPAYLASLGDDHRPRTPGWDRILIDAIEGLGGSGFAYGNDLFQGSRLPTAWVVSADIVRAVGWMMLPTCAHIAVDNAVLELGRALGRIVYRPDVVVEHLHPQAGKAAWDASYRHSNAPDRFAADVAAFEEWKANGGLAADVALVAKFGRAVR